MPVQLNPRPARRGSMDANRIPPPGPMDPRQAAALMREAERRPDLDIEALAVLRALLFSFTSWRSGECAPSLEAIARRAKVSRATVCRRLVVLVAAGLVVRIRRAVLVGAAVGWRGAARWCQATTAYRFVRRAVASRPNCESPAEAPFPIQVKKTGSSEPAALSADLAAAFARLGQAIAGREAREKEA